MKKLSLVLCLVVLLAVPTLSNALAGIVKVEAAVGIWMINPSGDFEYKGTSNSTDLEDTFGFEDRISVGGRVKLKLPVIPNIYVMATPIKFDGDSKAEFIFDDVPFGVDANTKLTMNMYDVGLHYGIPFLGLATFDKVQINAGLNIRLLELKAEMSGAGKKENKNATVPVPLLFVAASVSPIDLFAIEAEVRAMSLGYADAISAIARLRVNSIGPLFFTGGYRYESVTLDTDDVELEINLSGPFIEAGFSF